MPKYTEPERILRAVRRRLGRIALAAIGAGLLSSCSTLPLPTEPSGPIGIVAVDQGTAQALISDYRRTHGLSTVEIDPALQRVAQRQAEAMASANLLSHQVAGSMPERLERAGIPRRAAIENVSAGYASLQAALGGWKRSPHHNENLLFGPMHRMGIAAASAPGTRYKTFWSLVMTN